MHEPIHEQPARPTHIARFEDGPRGGTTVAVLALESGQPPDVLLTPGQPDWVYVLAGGPRRDGSLPYLYMPPKKAAILLHSAARSTGGRVSSAR